MNLLSLRGEKDPLKRDGVGKECEGAFFWVLRRGFDTLLNLGKYLNISEPQFANL